jgi:TonB family protein
VALSTPQPTVPKGATPGEVVLEAYINTKGKVESVRVLRSTSESSAAAATEAVKQWKYKPAMLHGKPVPVYFTVLVLLCE